MLLWTRTAAGLGLLLSVPEPMLESIVYSHKPISVVID